MIKTVSMSKAMLGMSTLLFSSVVLAHHPLNGMPMETFFHGLLSGLAHPVLGIDHLFFIVAVGITAAVTRYALLSPLFAIAGVFAGVGLSVAGVQWVLNEYAIAVSLLLLGIIAMVGRKLNLALVLSLFAGLGIFHGLAFGAALTNLESAVAVVATGYLAGLALVHWLLAVAAGYVVRSASGDTPALLTLEQRLAGAVVAGAGAVYFLEHIEAHALSALGI